MLRRQVVHHDDAPGRDELERPPTLGSHLVGRASLPATAVEEEEIERRLGRKDLVPVAVEDTHLRIVSEQARAGSCTLVVDLDGDERRLRPERGSDPRGAEAGSGADLREPPVGGGTQPSAASRRPTSGIDERSKRIPGRKDLGAVNELKDVSTLLGDSHPARGSSVVSDGVAQIARHCGHSRAGQQP